MDEEGVKQGLTAAGARALAFDITNELAKLEQLAEDVAYVRAEAAGDPVHRRIYTENLAWKLHNFYTGCESVFVLVTEQLDGAPVSGTGWPRRLLERMAHAWEGRPAVIGRETAAMLDECLSFRHVVQVIYAFQLRLDRVDDLVDAYPAAWHAFRRDVRAFCEQLRALADALP
jgi:hypothetical protein